jgi:hypothetical protein
MSQGRKYVGRGAVARHPSNKGLVAWWLPLSGRWSKDYKDIGPLGMHGAAVGTAAVDPGRAGFGALTTGVGNYVEIGSPVALQLTSGLTLSAWVRMTTANSFGMACGYFRGDGSPTGYGFYYDASLLHFFADVYNHDATKTFTADGLWHYVVGTYSDTTDERNIWIDGAKGTPHTNAAVPTYDPTASFRISSMSGGFTGWGGQVGSVRVLSRTLSDVQVAAETDQAFRGFPDLLRRRRPARVGVVATFQSAWATGSNPPVIHSGPFSGVF